MKNEKPILFSKTMVQALLQGRKTQTRRIIKPQPSAGVRWNAIMLSGKGGWADGHGSLLRCPYGKPGDILWVRESFQRIVDDDNSELIRYAADNPEPIYLVDGDGFHEVNSKGEERFVPFKPSIFMPKEAARIWLEVESVKVERLQEISNNDAMNEGILFYKDDFGAFRYKDYLADASGYGDPDHDYPTVDIATTSFSTLWRKINGAESWNQNPWLWVVKFKVLSTTGRPANL